MGKLGHTLRLLVGSRVVEYGGMGQVLVSQNGEKDRKKWVARECPLAMDKRKGQELASQRTGPSFKKGSISTSRPIELSAQQWQQPNDSLRVTIPSLVMVHQ